MNNPKIRGLMDTLLVLIVLVSVKQAVLPYSALLAGPASTFFAMILATWLLWRSNLSWRDLGLNWTVPIRSVLLQTGLTFFVIVATAVSVRAIVRLYFPETTTSGRFDFVEGNLVGYLFVMALVWTHGSFFEEMLFRAFLISRGSEIFGGGRVSEVIVVILLAIFFGYRHYYYQGMQGALVTGAIGLSLSVLYLWFGRKNLLSLIFAHGLVNSVSQTQRFLGD